MLELLNFLTYKNAMENVQTEQAPRRSMLYSTKLDEANRYLGHKKHKLQH